MTPAPTAVPGEPRRVAIRVPHWGWFLLATVVLVVGFVGLSIWLPWLREQEVVEKIESCGGGFTTEVGGPVWIRRFVGEDRLKKFKVFGRVNRVHLRGTAITDADIAAFSGLTNLRDLY